MHGCKHPQKQSSVFLQRALMIPMNQFSLFWWRLPLFRVLAVVFVCCWLRGLCKPTESSADSGTCLVWDYSTRHFLCAVTFAAEHSAMNGDKRGKNARSWCILKFSCRATSSLYYIVLLFSACLCQNPLSPVFFTKAVKLECNVNAGLLLLETRWQSLQETFSVKQRHETTNSTDQLELVLASHT